jgi:hypothetical protein
VAAVGRRVLLRAFATWRRASSSRRRVKLARRIAVALLRQRSRVVLQRAWCAWTAAASSGASNSWRALDMHFQTVQRRCLRAWRRAVVQSVRTRALERRGRQARLRACVLMWRERASTATWQRRSDVQCAVLVRRARRAIVLRCWQRWRHFTASHRRQRRVYYAFAARKRLRVLQYVMHRWRGGTVDGYGVGLHRRRRDAAAAALLRHYRAARARQLRRGFDAWRRGAVLAAASAAVQRVSLQQRVLDDAHHRSAAHADALVAERGVLVSRVSQLKEELAAAAAAIHLHSEQRRRSSVVARRAQLQLAERMHAQRRREVQRTVLRAWALLSSRRAHATAQQTMAAVATDAVAAASRADDDRDALLRQVQLHAADARRLAAHAAAQDVCVRQLEARQVMADTLLEEKNRQLAQLAARVRELEQAAHDGCKPSKPRRTKRKAAAATAASGVCAGI